MQQTWRVLPIHLHIHPHLLSCLHVLSSWALVYGVKLQTLTVAPVWKSVCSPTVQCMSPSPQLSLFRDSTFYPVDLLRIHRFPNLLPYELYIFTCTYVYIYMHMYIDVCIMCFILTNLLSPRVPLTPKIGILYVSKLNFTIAIINLVVNSSLLRCFPALIAYNKRWSRRVSWTLDLN